MKSLGVVVLVCLLAYVPSLRAFGSDGQMRPSLTGLQKCDRHLRKYSTTVEVSETQFKRAQFNGDSRSLPGRFFQVTEGSRRQLVWLLPFAGGEACVVRQVVQLKGGGPLVVDSADGFLGFDPSE